jgi:hypothetical protein
VAYWLDDGFDTWPETVIAGTAAVGLYSRCGAWIARNIANGKLADAVIPGALARAYGTAEWVQRLVDVGLWSIEGDGYRDTRYFELNPTPEQLAERRAGAAERQRKSRSRRSHSDVTRDSPGSHSAPTLPSSPKGEGRGLRLVPDWCGRCDKNTRSAADEADRSVPCPNCHPRREEAS